MRIPQAVIMSINPEWCDLIVQGKKTVELRKSKPSLKVCMELPFNFTVYIYCTKSPKAFNGGQRVIGYFTCKWFDSIFPDGFFVGDTHLWCTNPAEDAITGYCLTEEEIKKYLKGKKGYGWHIDDLVIYEQPKTLEEFGLKRPPQSWCYVY